jgi:hypothetical protein
MFPSKTELRVQDRWKEKEDKIMPLYMDIHRNMKDITKEGLEEAHKKDLEVQGKYGVNYVDYWYSEKKGSVFCLCEAPDREAAAAVHRESHGAVADKIFEVKRGL